MRLYAFIALVVRSVPVGLACLFAASLQAATVEVKVSDSEGRPLAGATVSLVPSRRQVPTGVDGVARFENVTPGVYDVAVRLSGFASSRTDITVEPSGLNVPVALAAEAHFSESLTVSPDARDVFEAYQPTSVLGGDDLQQRLGNTLGATLASEPGVNVRSFGSGNARPSFGASTTTVC